MNAQSLHLFQYLLQNSAGQTKVSLTYRQRSEVISNIKNGNFSLSVVSFLVCTLKVNT